MSGEDPRRLALEVLGRIERDGAYANLVLRTALDRSNLDRRDRAFVTDLVWSYLILIGWLMFESPSKNGL